MEDAMNTLTAYNDGINYKMYLKLMNSGIKILLTAGYTLYLIPPTKFDTQNIIDNASAFLRYMACFMLAAVSGGPPIIVPRYSDEQLASPILHESLTYGVAHEDPGPFQYVS